MATSLQSLLLNVNECRGLRTVMNGDASAVDYVSNPKYHLSFLSVQKKQLAVKFLSQSPHHKKKIKKLPA